MLPIHILPPFAGLPPSSNTNLFVTIITITGLFLRVTGLHSILHLATDATSYASDFEPLFDRIVVLRTRIG